MSDYQLRQRLGIRLNSDLCVASGDGFSSSVDIDVCHDGSGVPVIPARRIKGCLREAADELGYSGTPAFDDLFGVKGATRSGSLRVSDAKLVGAQQVISEYLDNDEARNPQKVLGLFSYIRAQTSVDDGGSAKDGTLRFVRVVKQYAPSLQAADGYRPMQFLADIACKDDAEQVELLRKCCKALRNIGYGRNRGLGAISCELVSGEEANQVPNHTIPAELRGAKRIAYTVRLDSAVMLVQMKNSESLEYVPGSSVLGFFASKLRGSDLFDDLFLKGRVKFSPLYPVNESVRCRPAPPFIVKIKGGERDGRCCSVWQWREGESVKPLKDGFIGKDLRSKKPETEIVYHHSVADPTLYTQRCLKAGQHLSGYIEGDSDLLDLVLEEIERTAPGEFSFGRSKTAQYSRCTLAGIDIASDLPAIDVIAGKSYAFLLDSDALLLKGGTYTTDFHDLCTVMMDGLGAHEGLFGKPDIDTDAARFGSGLHFRTIAGYNAKWHQKKPHVTAYAAGSCVVVKAASNATGIPAEFSIGERQAEGFGRIVVVPINESGSPEIPFDPAPLNASPEPCVNDGGANATLSQEALRCAVIEYTNSERGTFGTRLGSAFIGRLSRMVDESTSRRDLDERVDSIKSDPKRRSARKVIEGVSSYCGQSLTWSTEKECLSLLFTLGKYYAKQAESDDAAKANDGGAR